MLCDSQGRRGGYEGIAGCSSTIILSIFSFYVSFKSLSFKDSSYKVQERKKRNKYYV